MIISATDAKIQGGRLVDETSLGFACGAVEALIAEIRLWRVAEAKSNTGSFQERPKGEAGTHEHRPLEYGFRVRPAAPRNDGMVPEMANDTVLCAIDARGVAAVTLNRPRVNNAYDGALIDALIATFGRLADDPALRVVVLRGAGKHFQAGADLSFLDHLRTVSPEENREFSRRTVAAIRGLQLFPRPVIALVQGGCFGGGVGIAAACDIAVAAEDAVFALSEVRWALLRRRSSRCWSSASARGRRGAWR